MSQEGEKTQFRLSKEARDMRICERIALGRYGTGNKADCAGCKDTITNFLAEGNNCEHCSACGQTIDTRKYYIGTKNGCRLTKNITLIQAGNVMSDVVQGHGENIYSPAEAYIPEEVN